MNRRNFLRQAGLAGAVAIVAPRVILAATKTKNKKAARWFADVRSAFMQSNWKQFDKLINAKANKRYPAKLRGTDKTDFKYMKSARRKAEPKWWKHCDSKTPASFTAKIWSKRFKINYKPSESLGLQRQVELEDGSLAVIVCWRPQYMGEHRIMSGRAIEKMLNHSYPHIEADKFSYNNLATTVAWHELGHNYITKSLPEAHIRKLYEDHRELFKNLQELYADLTVLHHGPTASKLFTMMFRAPSLMFYNQFECHARGCGHAVGALLLSEILKNPKKWPSFKFPGIWPKLDIERFAIAYTFANLSKKNWTFAEDKALASLVKGWCKQYGDKALRTKGKIFLRNGLKMNIVANEDYKLQLERDKWVAKKLTGLKKKGKTDSAKKVRAYIKQWSKVSEEFPDRYVAFLGKCSAYRTNKLKEAIAAEKKK